MTKRARPSKVRKASPQNDPIEKSPAKPPAPAAPPPADAAAAEPAVERARSPKPFLVAGVGASAGGLQAMQELFAHVPADVAAAFVVVTHQHPEHHSLLPELLRKSTELSVEEARDGQALQPGHIYVAPARAELGVKDGTLQHTIDDLGPGLHPIDYFFRSLARDMRERAVGVVLSGTGTDGTLGLAAIKDEGGITMAEDIRSASYPGMPENAIQSGAVDHVLPAAGLASQIATYANTQIVEPIDSGAAQRDEKKLLALLRARTGHDFTHYKKNTVRRRIERRMTLHRIHDIATYLRYLQDNPAEIDAMYRELLIGVTSFFRDLETFEALAGVLAKLVAACPEDHAVRVWVPGCSSGEEAYSIAILLREAMERAKKHIMVRLFATDVDAEAIDRARTGVYPASIAADVGSERLQRYFAHEDGKYRVIKDVRDMIVFAPQNVLSDPPFTRLDLLSCRNLLIYMDAELQERLMTLFHYALRPGGVLFLGASESIGGHDDLFTVADKKSKIYVRESTATQARALPRPSPAPAGKRHEVPAAQALRPVSLPALAATLLLQTHVPPSVLVNERGEAVYIHGSTGAYLEPAAGQPSFNLVQMARDGLKLDLESVMRQAVLHGDRTIVREARVRDGAEHRKVRLTARRIHDPEPLRGLLLVTFESSPGAAGKGKAPALRRGVRGVALEEELQSTKQNLESTIEQLQASNEELQSANEELSSMNEEMQSANEELEISKEETQALNEELHTVNAELRGTVDDLSRTNDDMTNLLNSIEIATIFLDRGLRVRRFTTHATRVIHLIPSDVGRPLADIMPKVKYDRLVADAEEVFRTLVPKEVEIESKEGGWFLMRLLPYRTSHERIDGLVMTFVDVTKMREASAATRARALAESIVQAVREPLMVLGGDTRVMVCNRAFHAVFPRSAASADGKLLHEVGEGRWDVPALRTLVERVLAEQASGEARKIAFDPEGQGSAEIVTSAVRLEPKTDLPLRVLLTFPELRVSPALTGAAEGPSLLAR